MPQQELLFEINRGAVGFGVEPDVLTSVDLTLREAEFLSILGPSGCGKSTLLNVAAGLLKLRAGSASFAGSPIRGVNTNVGYMTQDDTLMPWRSVLTNVMLPLRLRRVPREQAEEAAREMLARMELTEAAKKFPSQLSGGMRRRALLARSMIYSPKVLLMDEPFGALDAQLKTEMHGQLLKAVREDRQAVLFVTHDIQEAALLSDRVIVLGGTPARPLHEVQVPFGRDRDPADLVFDENFVSIERQLREALDDARVSRRSIAKETSR